MFANFEVCRAGLVTAAPQRRHARTATGCLQCRQRKKKCDERFPICSLCSKYGTACESAQRPRQTSRARSRPGLPQNAPSSPRPSNVSSQSPISVLSADSADSDYGVPSGLELALPMGPFTLIPDTTGDGGTRNGFETYSLSIRAHVRSPALAAFNLPNEQRVLHFLLEKFEGLTSPAYINSKLSILYHALPIAVASPVLKNALMACGFALLARTSSGVDDSIQAKSYQCKALNGLAGNLLQGHEEENLSTILLLHIFEKISCDSLQSKRIHLLGANSLIGSTLNTPASRSEPTKLHMYLVEAYIYHIALSSTFSGIAMAPFQNDHVSKLLAVLEKSSGEPSNMWKESSLIGVSHGIFDVIFRSSLLRRQLPLTTFNRHYAQELKNTLLNWQWPISKDEITEVGGQLTLSPPEAMLRTGQLYRLACLLLLEKILDPSLQSNDNVPRYLVTAFCQIIQQISVEDVKQSVHLWPLLIMGSAARTPSECALFLAPLEHNPSTSSFGNRLQGCTLLMESWVVGEGSNGALGLDILLRDDLLYQDERLELRLGDGVALERRFAKSRLPLRYYTPLLTNAAHVYRVSTSYEISRYCIMGHANTQIYNCKLPFCLLTGRGNDHDLEQDTHMAGDLLGEADERDRIYAFLGSVTAKVGENGTVIVVPDYEKDFRGVYLEFAIAWLENTHDLGLLSAVEHTTETFEDDPPSWVPRWDVSLTNKLFRAL